MENRKNEEIKTDIIYNEDCKGGLKRLPENSIDIMVTDPPYGISFMGENWDKAIPSIDIWKECIRVLKPGSFAFIMSAPRLDCLSQMAIRLQKAGFNVGFTPIFWTYASGFPKGMNIEKKSIERGYPYEKAVIMRGAYAGFQPKPAVEVVIVAMKPLDKKNYLSQAMHNQKGVTWMDNCRIPYANDSDIEDSKKLGEQFEGKSFNTGVYNTNVNHSFVRKEYNPSEKGRFPGNLLVSDKVLDTGKITVSGGVGGRPNHDRGEGYGFKPMDENSPDVPADAGDYSRYFSLDLWWVKKVPKSVRKTLPFIICPKPTKEEKGKENIHLTVKPIKLMSYLIELGSMPFDIVLDPFIGSGTTAIASIITGRRYIGYEIDKKHYDIAIKRVNEYNKNIRLWEYGGG